MEELIVIISVVVFFIILICFFVLCVNVASIRKKISQDDSRFLYQKFNKAIAFGDTEESKTLLKQIIWNDILKINRDNLSYDQKIAKYDKLEVDYKEILDKVGIQFPSKEIASKS